MPTVTVLYFAQVGERLQREREQLELPEATSSGEILAALALRHPAAAELVAHSRLAVDCDFVDGAVRLHPGSEVAVIPPVSGG